MYIYFLLVGLFLIDLYMFIISPYLDSFYRKKNELKRISSIHYEKYGPFLLKIEEFPKKKLIGIEGTGSLIIDIPYIKLDDRVKLDSFTLKNVKKIESFNIECEDVNFENSTYHFLNGMIFNKNEEILFLTKSFEFSSLIEIVKNYAVSKKALKYFSNAPYVQFNKKNDEIRVSKPFDFKCDSFFLACPKKVGKVIIRNIYINIGEMTDLYISDEISNVVLEKESMYLNINNDSKQLKIRNNCLVHRYTQKYVMFQGNVFRLKNTSNPVSKSYILKYKFTKFEGKLRIN